MDEKPPAGALVRHVHDGRVGQVIERFELEPVDVAQVEWVGQPVRDDDVGDFVDLRLLEYVH